MNMGKLQAWIEKQIDKGASKFEAMTMPDRSVLDSWPASGVDDTEELCEQIAVVLDGVESGSVRCEMAGGGSAIFRIGEPKAALVKPGQSELDRAPHAPEHVGVQIMRVLARQNEQLHTRIVDLAIASNKTLREENADLRRRISLADKRATNIQAERERLSEKRRRRELEEAESLAKRERTGKIVDKVTALLPVLASKFMGRPDHEGAYGAVVDVLRKSITDEQFNVIMRTLTPEQQIQLYHLLNVDGADKSPPADEKKEDQK